MSDICRAPCSLKIMTHIHDPLLGSDHKIRSGSQLHFVNISKLRGAPYSPPWISLDTRKRYSLLGKAPLCTCSNMILGSHCCLPSYPTPPILTSGSNSTEEFENLCLTLSHPKCCCGARKVERVTTIWVCCFCSASHMHFGIIPCIMV